VELQSAGVDAVPLARRRGAVVEDVAEVATATFAQDLGAGHAETRILPELDVLRHRGLVEARPAGAGVELRPGGEQLRAAARASVGAVVLDVDVLAGERPLSRLTPQHLVLLGTQSLAPLLVGQLDLVFCLHDSHDIAGPVL
jgi:hypothetical protein